MCSNKDQCWTSILLKRRRVKDRGLMGPAHAASAGGIFMLIAGLAPIFTTHVLGAYTVALIFLGLISCVGAALLPDLDNSRSTVRSALGVSGVVGSSIFRFTSSVIQHIVRTKRDDESPDPHRGFWHTFVGAALLGSITWWLCSIQHTITLPLIGEIGIGRLIAFIMVVLLSHIALSGVAKGVMKKLKKMPLFGEVISYAVSVIVVGGLFLFIPEDFSFRWLGVCVAVGMAIHIFGDGITRSGVPLWFPLSAFMFGKFWWQTRLAHFEAANKALNKTVSVLSAIAVVVGMIGCVMFWTNH